MSLTTTLPGPTRTFYYYKPGAHVSIGSYYNYPVLAVYKGGEELRVDRPWAQIEGMLRAGGWMIYHDLNPGGISLNKWWSEVVQLAIFDRVITVVFPDQTTLPTGHDKYFVEIP